MIALRRIFLYSAILLGVVGFSDFGDSLYWSFARPFSVILLVLYCTFHALEGELADYEKDQRSREKEIRAAEGAAGRAQEPERPWVGSHPGGAASSGAH